MTLEKGKVYEGFRLDEITQVNEINSTVFRFTHEVTKAKTLFVSNEDDNKVFLVGFRTPSIDDCGIAHIMEHSVLCGSKKYPLKEPFVELIKGSLNTFLNAMTFPDKTIYPVASKNNTDFANLIDVYCDAVFNPSIKNTKFTFLQEGWHHHIENKDEEIKVNGVVYNEMKGAFSSAEEVLLRNVLASLFPDTSYQFESGGDPDYIPELSYEKYVNFYDTYYHPSNSYIYFYGDMDITVHLKRLNEEYLSAYELKEIDSELICQKDFDVPKKVHLTYSKDEGELEDNCFFAKNYKIGGIENPLEIYSFSILSNILFEADSSPLKKALLDKHLADEIKHDFSTGVREPFYSIFAKNAKEENYQLFLDTIDEVLQDICEKGIDEDIIKAAVNSYEFDLREADSGSYPKGLLLGMEVLESWLYDLSPTLLLEYDKYFSQIKANMTSEYFTDLIKKYLLDNKNTSTILLSPEAGLDIRKSKALKAELESYKKSLSEEELQEKIDETLALMKHQEKEDTEEARATIPVVDISEIDARIPEPNFEVEEVGNTKIYHHIDSTSGIAYIDLNFKLECESTEEISVSELLSKVLGVYETKNYTERELANQIGMYLGDIDAVCQTYQDVKDCERYTAKFMFFSKLVVSNLDKFKLIASEILNNTKFNDPKRLAKTVAEEISKFSTKLVNASHIVVGARLNAMMYAKGAYNEYLAGSKYYEFLVKTKKELDNNDFSILEKLEKAYKKIINSNGLDILITCDEKSVDIVKSSVKALANEIADKEVTSNEIILQKEGILREGLIIPAKVSYVGLSGRFADKGFEYSPAMLVARKYLTGVYLWDNVRILGGAYGSFLTVDKNGSISLVSYRDPKIKQTFGVYDKLADHLKDLTLPESEVKKLIIGTISDIDSPMPAYTVGRVMLANTYKNETWARQQDNREKILSVSAKDISSLSELFRSAIEEGNICVASDEDSLKENMEFFDRIYSMTR